jgi:cytochrome P450
MAFGFGTHHYLGQQLARAELQVVSDTCTGGFPRSPPPGPLPEIPFKHDGRVYGVYELPVTW